MSNWFSKKFWVIGIFSLLNIAISLCEEANNSSGENINFDAIKDVIKKDMLDGEVLKQKNIAKKINIEKEEKIKRLYDIPAEHDFWQIFSEYWLVKNAPILKWDFEKPDYGIEQSFQVLLEKLGYYEKKFRILVINSPSVYHMALPSSDDNGIYLISLPFVRILDLSKLEISLLLLEDFLRLKADLFSKKVKTKELQSLFGNNFYKSKFDKNILAKASQAYDKLIFSEGFNFQQQFEITKEMSNILKSDPKLWTVYYKMILKIDDLVKGNELYRNYNKIYPSPELQINWLKPKGKIL